MNAEKAGKGRAVKAKKAKLKPRVKAAAPAKLKPRVTATAPAKVEPKAAGDTTRALDLLEGDWRWATWRTHSPPAPLRSPVPFDIDACCMRLAERVRVRRSKREWDFSGAELAPSMTKSEALFWLAAMTDIAAEVPPAKRASQLRKRIPPRPPSLAHVSRALAKSTVEPPFELPLVLANAFSPLEVSLMLLEEGKPPSDGEHAGGTFFHGYREHVFTRLGENERAVLEGKVRPAIAVDAFTSDHFEEPLGAFYLAALLGMHEELERLVSSWPDYWYAGEKKDALNTPQLMVFGLASAERVDHHMRRLELSLNEPVYVRAWLAHTELAGLDWIARSICETKDQAKATALAEVLALVRAPENAGPMLEVELRSKAKAVASAWLETHVGHAVFGYAKLAKGGGALAGVAVQRLKALRAEGFADLVAAASASEAGTGSTIELDVAIAERHLDEIEPVPSWLARGIAEVARSGEKPPRWLDRAALPPVEIDGKKLGGPHVDALLVALAGSSYEARHPLVTAVRRHATRESTEAFAWRIFDEWLLAGGQAKSKWALVGVGLLGDDGSALKLAPLVRAWPGENLHQRAVWGVEALAAIGTDAAVVLIIGLAQKLWFPALRKRAEEMLEIIAEQRKTTRDDLEDSIVPDGGFDEGGRRVFTLGQRTFEVVMERDATPMLRDAKGVRTEELPAAREGDDLVLFQHAAAEWKTLRDALKQTFDVQSDRLEQAMVRGRTWKPDAFMKRVARHPLMSHLARTIVWGVYAQGEVVATFRVAEDGSLADTSDSVYTLSGQADVGPVHPFDVDEATRARWSSTLADYKILPAFEQLERPTFTILEEERDKSELGARFAGKEWDAHHFLDHLRQRGWSHGAVSGGCISDHEKHFPAHGVIATVCHRPHWFDRRSTRFPQSVLALYFVRSRADMWPRVPLAQVHARCLSEVLYDFSGLMTD